MPPFREVLAEMDLYRRVIPFKVKDLELKNALLGSQRLLSFETDTRKEPTDGA